MLEDERSALRSPANIDSANYLPGSSLRGDGGCLHWNCRLPKVRALARYIALYCDKAVVPLRLPDISERADVQAEALERIRLCAILLGLVELRPLMEADLVALVPEELHLCKEHWDEAVPEHKRIWKSVKKLAIDNLSRFSATYYPPRNPLSQGSIHFRGPKEYLEHGEIRTVLENIPSWLSLRARNRRIRLTEAELRRHDLILRFFLRMANDAFLQTYFGAAFNARYVTDSVGEGQFFQMLYGGDQLARKTASLCAHLSHTVPIMTEVPVRKVLDLRRSEPEAFQTYRSTLTKIVKEHASGRASVTETEAREIYTDLLKPRLDELENQATNLRKSQLKKGLTKVVATFAVIGVGIYGGILPAHLAELVKAIGGFSVTKDLAETIGALQRNPTEIRNNNLYFLLRLKQAGRGAGKNLS